MGIANRLNWDHLINELGEYYCEGSGRPEIPIRIIAGLHYLKYLENESDESVVEKFCKIYTGNIFVVAKHFNTNCHAIRQRWLSGVNESVKKA